MDVISAGEDELFKFFEVERSDADAPWPYNEFRYEVRREDFALLRLRLARAG